MNIIYLNERKKICIAHPEASGCLVVPDKSIILGFVNEGRQYFLNDKDNKILTPFENYIVHNPMSIDFVEPKFFSKEDRNVCLTGLTFEEKETFVNPFEFKNDSQKYAEEYETFFQFEANKTVNGQTTYYPFQWLVKKRSGTQTLDVTRLKNGGADSEEFRLALDQSKDYVLIYATGTSLEPATADTYKAEIIDAGNVVMSKTDFYQKTDKFAVYDDLGSADDDDLLTPIELAERGIDMANVEVINLAELALVDLPSYVGFNITNTSTTDYITWFRVVDLNTGDNMFTSFGPGVSPGQTQFHGNSLLVGANARLLWKNGAGTQYQTDYGIVQDGVPMEFSENGSFGM